MGFFTSLPILLSQIAGALEIHEPTAWAFIGMMGTMLGVCYLSFRANRPRLRN